VTDPFYQNKCAPVCGLSGSHLLVVWQYLFCKFYVDVSLEQCNIYNGTHFDV